MLAFFSNFPSAEIAVFELYKISNNSANFKCEIFLKFHDVFLWRIVKLPIKETSEIRAQALFLKVLEQSGKFEMWSF